MAATVRDGKRTDLVGGTPFDLHAGDTGKPKSRVPEILVGTFLVALFALGGAWFYSTSTASVGYLGLRQDLNRGDVVEADDLTVFEINTEAPVRGLGVRQQQEVIGKVALTDMQQGAIVTPEQFTEQDRIPAGFGVVGLNLGLGEFPSLSIRPGDRVRVVMLPGASRPEPEDGEEHLIIDSIEVLEVVTVGSNGRLISLVMPTEEAELVAIAHSGDRVRLVQVPDGDSG